MFNVVKILFGADNCELAGDYTGRAIGDQYVCGIGCVARVIHIEYEAVSENLKIDLISVSGKLQGVCIRNRQGQTVAINIRKSGFGKIDCIRQEHVFCI